MRLAFRAWKNRSGNSGATSFHGMNSGATSKKTFFVFLTAVFSASLANTHGSAMTRSRGVRAGAVQAVRGAGDRRRARPGPHARE